MGYPNEWGGDGPWHPTPSPPSNRQSKFPATAQPPNQPPPTLQRAVLAAVAPVGSDPTTVVNPTSCSLLIMNRLPMRSGYSLPAGVGVIYREGATVTTPNGTVIPAPGPFFNGTDNKGGTWVLVNTETMTVVSFLQGVSTSFPTSAGGFVPTHLHNGGVDPYGNPMPPPIGGTQMQGMPAGTTFSVSSFTLGAHTGIGGGAIAVALTLSLSITTSMPVNQWLSEVYILGKPTSTGVLDGDTNPDNFHPLGRIPINGFSNPLHCTVGPIGGGLQYELAVRLVDQQGIGSALCVPFGIVTAEGVLVGTAPNMIKDSNIDYAPYQGGPPRWALTAQYAHPNPAMSHPQFDFVEGQQSDKGLENVIIIGNAAPSQAEVAFDGRPVVANQVYVYSAYIDAGAITAGAAAVSLYDSLTGGTLLARVTSNVGRNVIWSTYTPSTNGTVYLRVQRNGCTIGAIGAGSLIFATPMLYPGNTLQSYNPGGIVGTDGLLPHGIMSAQTRATIMDAVDAQGSYVQPGVLHRGHFIAEQESDGVGGGANYLFNPSFAGTTKGWNLYQDPNVASYEQQKATGEAGGNLTLTFGSPPTSGNLMVACIAYPSGSPVTPPTGWTAQASLTNPGLTLYTRTVSPGDPSSYTWTTVGTPVRGIMYELVGVASFQTATVNATGATVGTPTLTPLIYNNIPLAFFSSLSANATATPSAGWTTDTYLQTSIGGSQAYTLEVEKNASVSYPSGNMEPLTAGVTWAGSSATSGILFLTAPTQAPSGIVTWIADGGQSGRLRATAPNSASAVSEFYQQKVTNIINYLAPNATLSGVIGLASIGNGDVTKTQVRVDCVSVGGSILGTYTLGYGQSANPTQYPYIIPISGLDATMFPLYIRARVSNAASNGSVVANFYKLQFEYGPTSSIFEDYTAMQVTAALCDPPPFNGDGSPLSTGIVTPRTLDRAYSRHFVFVQASPLTVWNITHNLGAHPVVNILDSGGSVVWADVLHNSLNDLTITFSAAMGGEANLVA